MVAPAMKLVPVRVTGTLCPWMPLFGLIALSVGGAWFTVKIWTPLVPPKVAILTLWTPTVAFPAIANNALICVALITTVLLTATPVPLKPMVAPAMKLVPVSVTGTLSPWTPLFGLIAVNVGDAAFTVNIWAPLIPAGVVTVTFRTPVAALPATVNVAVICVALTTVVLLTEIPEPLRLMVAPATKFVPVRVTDTVCPWTALAELIEVRVGGVGGLTVNVCAPLVPPEVVTVTW